MIRRNQLRFGLLALSLFAASLAHAQANVGLKAIGGGLGLVDPDGPIGLSILLEGTADLGEISPNLGLDVRLGFWSNSKKFAGGASRSELSSRDFIIGGGVKYMFDINNEQMRPYAGGGLSMHIAKVTTRLPNPPDVIISDTELAFDIRGGVKYLLNPNIDVIGEVMFTTGDAEQLTIKAIFLFKLDR